MRHWRGSDDTTDDGVNVLLRELFPPKRETLSVTASQVATKLFIIGPPKSGKSVMCKKLVIRILASKQIKREFGIVPVLINVNKLVSNYFKELEDRSGDNDDDEGEAQGKEEEKGEDGERTGGPKQAWKAAASPKNKEQKKGKKGKRGKKKGLVEAEDDSIPNQSTEKGGAGEEESPAGNGKADIQIDLIDAHFHQEVRYTEGA
jgi:hypothetical protein